MERGLLTDLAAHMEWADAKVWETVLASETARADAKLLGWLQHLHAVQGGFLILWHGGSLPPQPPEVTDLLMLPRWARDGHAALQAFLSSADTAVFDTALHAPWAAQVEESLKRPPAPVTIGESALQVIIHSAHHRAQVNARLRDLGAEPPAIDYIVWLWLGRPNAEWKFLKSDVIPSGIPSPTGPCTR
jgi:uncharacterized damage-inducible protein DinB